MGKTIISKRIASIHIASTAPRSLIQYAVSGVQINPPSDNPVDETAKAIDRSGPSNHLVIRVVDTTIDIPALPTPNRLNKQ